MAVWCVAGGVEGPADGRDLAVHHPRGGHHVGAGVGLGHRHPGVTVEGGVVVDLAGGREQATVAVVGVLVEAEVGHHHQLVADLVADVVQGELGDAVGGPGLGALGVLAVGGRDAEEDDARDAEVGESPDLLAQRLSGVLDDPRHRWDGCRLGDTGPDEQGRHQVVDRQPGLGHQPAQGRRAPQPPQPPGGKAHSPRS